MTQVGAFSFNQPVSGVLYVLYTVPLRDVVDLISGGVAKFKRGKTAVHSYIWYVY